MTTVKAAVKRVTLTRIVMVTMVRLMLMTLLRTTIPINILSPIWQGPESPDSTSQGRGQTCGTQNWWSIVFLLIDRGLSSGANNVSHHRAHVSLTMRQLVIRTLDE